MVTCKSKMTSLRFGLFVKKKKVIILTDYMVIMMK